MLRHPRFLQVMHRLALMGALLMAVAPVVSRWMQPDAEADRLRQLTDLCTSGGLQQLEAGAVMASAHAAHMMSMDLAMSGMGHGDAGTLSVDHRDGMACDYCVLAANLLPFLLLVLLLPLLQQAMTQPPALRTVPFGASAWPAHGARGPPDALPA
ncbi:hypothetical protein A7D17_11405 [Xanthomonas floridensis]|nr:hypothetical protein A7D17_11405 [Xanthomonas floridensis]